MAGKFNKQKKESVLKSLLQEKKSTSDKSKENLIFSFEDFCSQQKFASSFKDWQKDGLLSKAMETLHGYCKGPIVFDGDKFGLYGDFPDEDSTMFVFPEHVAEDAKWARLHITGPAVIIGHIIRNTFYVVFLDKTHKFYLSGKAKQQFKGK